MHAISPVIIAETTNYTVVEQKSVQARSPRNAQPADPDTSALLVGRWLTARHRERLLGNSSPEPGGKRA